MTNIIKTYPIWAIDSLRLRIPLSLINYDKQALANHQVISSYGELIKEIKNYEPFKDGQTNIYISKGSYNKNGETYEFIEILASAKNLKGDYFQGITKENHRKIYAAIMRTKVVKFSYKTFIKTSLMDVDFKKDLSCNHETFKRIIDTIKSNSKLSSKYGIGYTDYSNKELTNQGIEFGNNKRRGQTNADVFLKYYNKTFQLLNDEKTKRFINEYFENKQIPNFIRVEYNIINPKRFKRLGNKKHFTLETLLNLSQSEQTKMYNQITNYHMENINIMPKQNKEGSDKSEELLKILLTMPTEKDYQIMLDKNYQIASHTISINHSDNKFKKSRYLKELKKVYTDLKTQKIPITRADESAWEKYKEIMHI